MKPKEGFDDQFDLERFILAQEKLFESVQSELRAGRKRTHWMWFFFPQAPLGQSQISRMYAIETLDEAKAYLEHPLLGKRLVHCAKLVLEAKAQSVSQIFPPPDDLKLRSSMTLFALLDAEPTFQSVLDKYFGGRRDPATIEVLE